MPVYVSDLFTATPAPVNATPTSTRTWQWLRGSSAISGATSSTYTAVTADIGSPLSATQLETNFLATTTATSAATEVVQAFDPIRLFSASEPGVWYDPSDMSTLFQNATGTIPVTSFGQPVGLMLDKSRGLVLGPELVVNGDFADPVTTGWAASGSAVLSVVSGRLRVANGATLTGGATYVFSTVAGRSYKWTYFADAATSGGVVVRARDNTTLAVLQTATITTSGSYSVIFVAQGSTTQIQGVNTNSTIGSYSEFDNISVKELPGLHATQSTEASRPLYGIVPVSGRRNIFTYSEQFTAVPPWSWNAGRTITTDAGLAPDGTMTADLLTEDTSTGTHKTGTNAAIYTAGVVQTTSVFVRPNGRTRFEMRFENDTQLNAGFNLSTLQVTSTGLNVVNSGVTDVGGGWYRCFVASAPSKANPYVAFMLADSSGSVSYTGDGTSGVFLWGAQLELGSTATAYQRVSTDLDVTEAGVASVGYLRFDGSTSWMVTPTITPGTDKVQVFAGVRKLSDALLGMLVELSASRDANLGTFDLRSDAGGSWSSLSHGTAAASSTQNVTTAVYAAPESSVLSALHDIAGDSTRLRRNSTEPSAATGDKGAGNFGVYQMYIGRRGGTDFPFNGHLFPLIVRFGPNLTAARIAATEAWVATKTGGVTL